jgi:hypothetical protein
MGHFSNPRDSVYLAKSRSESPVLRAVRVRLSRHAPEYAVPPDAPLALRPENALTHRAFSLVAAAAAANAAARALFADYRAR